MKKRLVEVINNPLSIVEIYLDEQCTEVTEIKCLTDNRVKEYKYPIDTFFARTEVPREVKNKVAIAMTR